MEDEQINRGGINPDKPISREGDDLLGRGMLAARIAAQINNLGDYERDSIVIGIEGEWGGGKTSLINLTLNRVRPNKKNLIVEFNPWNFSDRNKLIKDFFNSIFDELNRLENKNFKARVFWRIYRRWKWFRSFAKWYTRPKKKMGYLLRVRLLWLIVWLFKLLVWLLGRLPWLFSLLSVRVEGEKIGNYTSKLLDNSELEVSPSASVLLPPWVITFQLTGRWKFRRESDDPLEEQKAKVNKLIRDTGKRMVIVIDDIDRLDIEETKLILKLVKLIANFPGTVFMLSYDRSKVGQRIDALGISGEEYLEKIIQQPIPIPEPDPEDVVTLLDHAISEELARAGFEPEDWQNERYKAITASSGFGLFSTIRDIKRYTNSLRLNLRILGEEVDLVDFIGIEVIRVFAPEVYLAMTGEMLTFTSPNRDPIAIDDDEWKKLCSTRLKGILCKAEGELRNSIERLLHLLFPLLPPIKQRIVYNSRFFLLNQETADPQAWRKGRRVCSPGTFDQYFLLSIPKTHLSSEEEDSFFVAAGEGVETLMKELRVFREKNKLLCLLNRTLPNHLDELDDKQLENILVSILDFVEEIDEEGTVDPYVIHQAGDMNYLILGKINRKKRTEFLIRLIDATTGFAIMTKLFNSLVEELEAYEKHRGRESLLTRDGINKAGKTYAVKIKKVAQDGSLLSRKKWAPALFIWRRWGVEEEVKLYVSRLLNTDEGLLTLLRGFHMYTMTRVGADIGIEGTGIIDKESLGIIIDLNELDERVNAIDLDKLSEEDAEIIKLYKTPPNNLKDRIYESLDKGKNPMNPS